MSIRVAVCAVLVASTVSAASLGTEFTYQGVLSQGGTSVDGLYDFRFLLYDAEVGGSQVGPIVVVENLTVAEGRVNTQVDFGDVFDGTALWLEISVRDGVETGPYTVLSPRQALTAAPFAQHSKDAETAGLADDSVLLNGQPAGYYLAWSNLVGVPGDILDGDQDTLGDLSCAADQIARWNGADWSCSSDIKSPFLRTYVVGPVGNPLANGAALEQALGDISPLPVSRETAVLVRIEPGVYDLGDGTVALFPWMVIEGAGRNHTRITSAYCGMGVYEGTLWSASAFAELRRLTVANTCSDPARYSIALSNQGDDLTVEDVLLIADQGAYRTIAMFNSGEPVTVKDASLQAENGANLSVGLWNQGEGAVLEDVDVRVGASQVVRGIECDGTGLSLRGGDVQLYGGVSECTGLLGNTATNPLLLEGLEIRNWCSSSSDNGLYLNGLSATLTDVFATAEDTALNLHNPSASIMYINLHQTKLEAATPGYGVWCQDEGTVGLSLIIQGSQVRSGGMGVYNHLDQCTVRIGGSQIAGGVTGAATCAGVHDSSYTFFANTCPP